MVYKKGEPQHIPYKVKSCGKAHAACGICAPERSERIRATMTGRPRTPEQVATMRYARWGVPLPQPITDRFGQPSKPLPTGVVSHVFPRELGRGRGLTTAEGYNASGECWVTVEGTGEEVLCRARKGVEVKLGNRVRLSGRDNEWVEAVI